MKFTIPLIAIAVLAGSTVSAQTVVLKRANPLFTGSGINVSVSSDSGDNFSTVGAGEFNLDVVESNDSRFTVGSIFRTFCLQVDVNLAGGGAEIDYNLVDEFAYFGSAQRVQDIGTLWTNFGGANLNTGTAQEQDRKRAAFQLALWELTLDTDPFSLDDGTFQVGAQSPVTRGIAAGWLDQINGGTLSNNFFVRVLESDPSNASQDLIFFEPIPEPATMLALGLGAGLLAARRRRKSA